MARKRTLEAENALPFNDYGRAGSVIPQGPIDRLAMTAAPSGELDTKPIFGASAVQFIRMSMFNPLRDFRPQKLSLWIQEQEQGFLSSALRAWEAMARRDDTIITVKGKKEDAVAQRSWSILHTSKAKDDAGTARESQSQKERLEYFWNNMTCISAWDRNVKGGFAQFCRFVVHVQSMRYGGIHFNWKISSKGITAELEFVPGWLFENLTGELRFLGTNPATVYGMPLDPQNWLPIAGRGIMEAASLCYAYKHLGLETWIKFCARHGMPFPLGKTPAAPNSPEWRQMELAVKGINNDGGAVIGDGADITLIEAGGSAGVSPSKELIERLDRALSAMFRGGDLSTMSSTAGQGTGSNQQTNEGKIVENADCQFVSEVMQQIEKKVLEWYDGEGVEALAFGNIKGPSMADTEQEMKIDEAAVKYGIPIAVADWCERYNRAPADSGDDILRSSAPVDPLTKIEPPTPDKAENSRPHPQPADLANQLEIQQAVAKDLQAIHDAIVEAGVDSDKLQAIDWSGAVDTVMKGNCVAEWLNGAVTQAAFKALGLTPEQAQDILHKVTQPKL
jgi:phage gp29-like protein